VRVRQRVPAARPTRGGVWAGQSSCFSTAKVGSHSRLSVRLYLVRQLACVAGLSAEMPYTAKPLALYAAAWSLWPLAWVVQPNVLALG
jgi:hypothetical protein